jgi:aromatic-L-amino-acid/L-tryptophan decarboxylase
MLRMYASREAHNWLRIAVDLAGLGTEAIHWVDTTSDLTMDTTALEAAIAADREQGHIPIAVIGTAGSVGTGAIDPLLRIAEACKEFDLWFHVDGAYGGLAAMLPDAPDDLYGLREADSVAVDPHKWLYAPIDVGCTLVRDPEALHRTFESTATYYTQANSPQSAINLFEMAPENSRRFRALKVWLQLQMAGRDGYCRMIADDIALSRHLYEQVAQADELEAWTHSLSITTFRYVPPDLAASADEHLDYLNELNAKLLSRIQHSGELYISNTTVSGVFLLRTCIVNFRTTREDIEAVPPLVVKLGQEVDQALRGSPG